MSSVVSLFVQRTRPSFSLSLSLARARISLSSAREKQQRERQRDTQPLSRSRFSTPWIRVKRGKHIETNWPIVKPPSHLFHSHNGAFLCTRPQGELLSFLVDAKKTYTASSIVSLESAFSKLHFGHEHAQDLPLPLSSILAPPSRPPLLSPLSFPLSSRRQRPLAHAREKTQKNSTQK